MLGQKCSQQGSPTGSGGTPFWHVFANKNAKNFSKKSDLLSEKLEETNWFKIWFNFFYSFFWDYDLVLCEGFKSFPFFPKIWVIKAEEISLIKEEIEKIKKELKNLVGFFSKEFSSLPQEFLQELAQKYPSYVFFKNKEEIEDFIVKELRNFIE